MRLQALARACESFDRESRRAFSVLEGGEAGASFSVMQHCYLEWGG
jgi:hypothetical protein